MIRRSAIAAATILLLLAVASVARIEDRRAPMRAEALLRWVDARRGQVPHAAVVVTTTFVGGQALTATARLVCTGDHQSRIEYLSPPLRGVVAIQDGAQIRREGGSSPAMLVSSGAECAPSVGRHRRRFELLLRNYQPRHLGDAHVAGRPVRRLLLVHRYTNHLARRWWVDADTGVILRAEDYRADGTLGVRTAYRQVQALTPPGGWHPPVSLPHPVAPPALITEADLLHRLGLPDIRPRYVPVGYECEAFSEARCGCPCGEPIAHIQYSDGLRALSVFASRHGPALTDPVVVALPLGDMLRLRHRGAAFAFIGEVGLPELHRMAQSLP